MKRSKLILIALVALSVALFVLGCSNSTEDDTPAANAGTSEVTTTEADGNSDDTKSIYSSDMGTSNAESIALADAGVSASDVKYINSYMEYEDGEPHHYEVEFAVYDDASDIETQYKYEIEKTTGEILQVYSEQHGEDD